MPETAFLLAVRYPPLASRANRQQRGPSTAKTAVRCSPHRRRHRRRLTSRPSPPTEPRLKLASIPWCRPCPAFSSSWPPSRTLRHRKDPRYCCESYRIKQGWNTKWCVMGGSWVSRRPSRRDRPPSRTAPACSAPQPPAKGRDKRTVSTRENAAKGRE